MTYLRKRAPDSSSGPVIRSAAMDGLKITWLLGFTLAVILTACSRELPTPPELAYTRQLRPCCGAPPERLIHDPRILDSPEAGTIILVRVLEVGPQIEVDRKYVTMLVLKSWQGPISAGRVLHTPKGFLFHHGKPDDNLPYPFQSGDQGKELLIIRCCRMLSSDSDVIFVRRYWAWPAEKSQALMAALDQAVTDSMPTDKAGYDVRLQKELATLKDAEAKLEVAQSNHAPQAEILGLRYQLRVHEENASRIRRVRDFLDKHPEKSGESLDRLDRAAWQEVVTKEQQAAPH